MWVPVAVMMTCSCLSYIDRQALAVISPMILKDTGLSATNYADAVSVFSVVYMIANPLWGVAARLRRSSRRHASRRRHLDDRKRIARVGGRISRFRRGARSARIRRRRHFPGRPAHRGDSLPLGRQSRGMGISYSGASVGAIFAPLIITPIALKFGWRAAFLVTGALGALWLIVWWFVARPPLVRAAERKASGVSWPNLLERRFWLLVVGMGLGGAALGPTLYLCPAVSEVECWA